MYKIQDREKAWVTVFWRSTDSTVHSVVSSCSVGVKNQRVYICPFKVCISKHQTTKNKHKQWIMFLNIMSRLIMTLASFKKKTKNAVSDSCNADKIFGLNKKLILIPLIDCTWWMLVLFALYKSMYMCFLFLMWRCRIWRVGHRNWLWQLTP